MHALQTLIIGGGIAGTSLACSMAQRGAGNGVGLVDVDLYGKFSSSELNGGGVRSTFAEPINIQISLASTQYYRAHADLLDFRQRGYFWMYDQALWEQARTFLPVVREHGLIVEELDAARIRDRFPILSDISDLAGATFTPLDGRLSPHRLRMHYLSEAQRGGVDVLDRWRVIGIENDRPPYIVRMRRVGSRDVRRVLEDPQAQGSPHPGETIELTILAHRIVNAAGPWAAKIAALYRRSLAVSPLPRQVYLLEQRGVELEPLPFFLDYPQDIYFRHYEVDARPAVLVSWSDPAEPTRIDFTNHGAHYYEKNVKPRLVKRIAALSDAKLIGSFVGHYELSPDKGAIIGPVPEREGILNFNGLSAHGVMQSRALGEALAEYMLKGAWPSDFNLSALGESRFAPNKTLSEPMYV